MRKTAASAIVGLAMTVLSAAPAHAASTSSRGNVALSSFSHLVLSDTAAFLSGDDVIEVHDFTGAPTSTIAGETGAQGLALSPDGAKLYVALKGADALSVIDTATNTEATRIALPASSCPQELALVGTTLWFSYGCTGGHVGNVDLSADAPSPALDLLAGTAFTAPPVLAAGVAAPGKLVVADASDRTGSAVTVYDVAGETPAQSTTLPFHAVQEMHLSSDGAHVLVSPTCCVALKQLQLDDLSDTGSTFPGGTGMAEGPGGLVAFSESGAGSYGTNYLGNPNYLGNLTTTTSTGQFVKTFHFAGTTSYDTVVGLANGVSFDPSGTHLMMIGTSAGAHYAYVATDPGRQSASQTISPTTTVPRINALYGIRERLFFSSSFPDSPVVHVSRVGPHDTVALPDQHPTPNGGFYFTDKVSVRGTYRYVLTYPGDATHEDNVTSLVMKVSGLNNGPITITTSAARPYAYGSKPIVTAHLGATKNRVVSLYASPAGGTRVLLRRGVVDRNGNIGSRYTLTHNTTVQAVWDGDDTYNPTTSQRQLNTQVHISEIVYGASSRDGAYYVFNHSKDPVMRFGVTPDHTGDRIAYFLEELVNGKWVGAGGYDGPSLARGSQFYLGFGGAHRVGERARISFAYGGPRSARPTNCATSAAPVYIRFT